MSEREEQDLNSRDLYYIRESVTEMKQMLSKMVDKQQSIEADLNAIKLQHNAHIDSEGDLSKEVKELWAACRDHKEYTNNTFMPKSAPNAWRNNTQAWILFFIAIITAGKMLYDTTIGTEKINRQIQYSVERHAPYQITNKVEIK